MPHEVTSSRFAQALVTAVTVPMVIFAVMALAVTIHTGGDIWAALPGGDLFSRAYLDDLLLARDGHLRGAWLLERHNDVHRVVIPKLVFWLDAWWTGGQGGLTATVAALLQGLALLLWLGVIRRLPLAVADRVVLSAFAVLLMASMMLADTVRNPINIQWSCLVLATTLTGMGVQRLWQQRSPSAIAITACGMLMASLSAGPLPVLLAAVLLTALSCRPRALLWLVLASVCVLLLLIGLDIARIALASGETQPWLLDAYRAVLPAALWEQPGALPDSALVLYGYWLAAMAWFLGQFLLPGVGALLPVWAVIACTPVLAVICIRLCLKQAPLPRSLVYVCVYVGLLALAAAFVRGFISGAYSFRFANMGVLFVLALCCGSWLCATRAYQRAVLACLMLGYACLVSYVAWQQAGSAVVDASRARLSQVAYAVGSNDSRAIVETPGFYWEDISAALTREYRPAMQAAGFGVFAGQAYRVYAGEQSLPGKVVDCDVSVQWASPHDTDPLAWKAGGEAQDKQGHPLPYVLLLSDTGEAIGFGIASQHVGRLLAQWQSPPYWTAHWKTDAPMRHVRVIAWDDDEQCVPVDWSLGAVE